MHRPKLPRRVGNVTTGPQRRGPVLVALVLLAGCASPTASPSQAAPSTLSEPPSASAEPSPSGPPTSKLEDVSAFDVTVGTAPDWPVLLADSLWVLAPDGDTPAVVRMDPLTGAEQARVPLPGGSCEGIAAGFDSIWACTPDGLVRIDPATNAVTASVAYQTPALAGRLAVSEDAVWSMSGNVAATDIVRIDPSTNAVTATYPMGHSILQIAYGLGALWATAQRDGLLLRIDPADGTVAVAASDLVDPFAVATGAGHVWVGLQGKGTDEDPDPAVPDLLRFDPSTGAIGATDFFDYGLRPQQTKSAATITVTDDIVWLKGEDPFLIQLDPVTGEVVRIIASDRGSGAMVATDDAVWITLWRDDSVVRINL